MRTHRATAAVLAVVLAAGCTSEVPPTGGPTAAASPVPSADAPGPASTAPSVVPSPEPAVPATPFPGRPSPRPGSPAIADPYWLLFGGTETSSWTDQDGTEIRTDASENWQVIEGGSLDGTILVNGESVGLLRITTTTGDSGVGLSPIEEQYGKRIDSPPLEGRRGRPNRNWTYRTGTWGTTTVHVKELVPRLRGSGIDAMALWWVEERSTWAMLSTQRVDQIDAVLDALLGPPAP